MDIIMENYVFLNLLNTVFMKMKINLNLQIAVVMNFHLFPWPPD